MFYLFGLSGQNKNLDRKFLDNKNRQYQQEKKCPSFIIYYYYFTIAIAIAIAINFTSGFVRHYLSVPDLVSLMATTSVPYIKVYSRFLHAQTT